MENKEKLNNYIIKFAISLLQKSETIRDSIDLPKNNYQPNIAWNYVVEQIQYLKEPTLKKQISTDILKLICHDNFKIITTNLKGIDIRYLVTQLIINHCYLPLQK